MLQKILKFFLYLLVIALTAGVVIGSVILLDRPLIEAFIILGVLAAIWIIYIGVRTAIIRARARKQVQRILQTEESEPETDPGMAEKVLHAELRKNWRRALKALRSSQLKLRGDPLYVLPWFMVFGKPESGKSSSLRSARLLAPKIDFPEHREGSTLNLDWWLYEEAIVIDTAGRYAVPDHEKRDRKEWRTFLKMLSRHKQKEPLSGLVLIVAADRLLEVSEGELLEEGRQLRASISDLMGKLEAKPPIYLMVTKCDLIPGFSEWCQYLPGESLLQPMGYLNEEEGGTLDEVIDKGLDVVLARIKELRLLMLERSSNPGDSLLTLPVEMERLRTGLHIFATTALKQNVYQETPRFRGLYFSSSIDSESQAGVERGTMGAFLHHFYTRILPSDRGMTDNLAAAVRLRNAVRTFSLSAGGAITVVTLLALSALYSQDMEELGGIKAKYGAINLDQTLVNAELASLNRLRELIVALEDAHSGWLVPWTGSVDRPAQVQKLIDTYNSRFRTLVVTRLDDPLKKRIATLTPIETSSVAGGIVRRINMLRTTSDGKVEIPLEDLPEITGDYLMLMDRSISKEAASHFNDLYIAYLKWSSSSVGLTEERATLQAALLDLLERNQGDYAWIIDWADKMGGDPVRLSDFWGGSRTTDPEAPYVPAAYTTTGREAVMEFMAELEQANDDSGRLATIMEEFDEYYERKYVRAWLEFAKRFDEGQKNLWNRKDWLNSVERMATEGNPYFSLLERLHLEMASISYDDDFLARDLVDYFHDVKAFVASSDGGKGGNNSKLALKLLSKAGKAGKMVAKVGKKAVKAKKKMGGKSPEELESLLEQAAKGFGDYQKALSEIAFTAEARPQSMSTMATLFTSPDAPASGTGPMAEAEKALAGMQMLIGKPNVESQIFWHLLSGPLRVGYEFMREETGCHLQDQWERTVLAELEGVAPNKIANSLIGDGGLIWKYIETNAGPFLQKRHLRGYQSAVVDGRSIEWTPEFKEFTNNASVGKHLVAGEFTVRLTALPTGVNNSAALSPYSAILELRCADGPQTLANYNYNASTDFKWSLEKCGDVSLTIAIGQMNLRKEYKGEKGFPMFLADFRDGHRVFVAEEFPEVLAQLRNVGVQAIDVNYQISGQEPLLNLLRSAPLGAPTQVATCWQ